MKTFYILDETDLSVHFHMNPARRKRMRALLGLGEIKPDPPSNGSRHKQFIRCSWGAYDPEVCAFLTREDAQKIVDLISPHGGSGLVVVDRESLFDVLGLEDVFWAKLGSLPDVGKVRLDRERERRSARKVQAAAEHALQSEAVQAMRFAPRCLMTTPAAI